MLIHSDEIKRFNDARKDAHVHRYQFLQEVLHESSIDVDIIIQKIAAFEVAIPSWALGAGGTRFGRFSIGGEPRTLLEKLEDVGLLHALSGHCGSISLHIPWDIPDDISSLKRYAEGVNLKFDAVNSNTFQDQPGQHFSYKFGSLSHVNKSVRQQAIEHNKQVIDIGLALGSKALTIWLADGSNFPGQHCLRGALGRTRDSLGEIYGHLPADWQMLIEYKPYEPNFYSMVISDWGTSFLLASKLGGKATCLVDLGHHLPNSNIEQIVATLMMEKKLGGFHFNDSKYGDDDLTVGSLKPYQLFLIFNELVDGLQNSVNSPAWMIDASHNIKDPLEDLLQSLEAILIAYTQALLIDRYALAGAQHENDVTGAQEVLQKAFRTDVRPLLAEVRLRKQACLEPLTLFRELKVRDQLVNARGHKSRSSGL
jgi:L-rhamnose isomerase / sugar isomerase